MANKEELLTTLQNKFDNLSLEELDLLKNCFHDFYQDKHFHDYFKKYLISSKTQNVCCPVCGSTHIIKSGVDQFNDQRYKCKNTACKRQTFTLKANTLMYYSKCKGEQWLTFFKCLFHKETVHTTMTKVGVCENTVLLWRHKTMYLIYKMLTHEKLEGLVELDETLFKCIYKGIEQSIEESEARPKRGISSDKINVICAIDESNRIIVQVAQRGRITSKALINGLKPYINETNTIVSDSHRSYHRLQKELGYKWVKIPSGKKSYNGYTLTKINRLHGNIKQFMSIFRGVSVSFLQGYLSLFEVLRRYPRYYQEKSFRSLVSQILTEPMKYRCYHFNSDFSYD